MEERAEFGVLER